MLKVLGDPDDPRTEVEKVAGLSRTSTTNFRRRGRAQSAKATQHRQAAELADRADLRHVPFTTIDPETARDFDDAVAVEELPSGGIACGSRSPTSPTTCARARPSTTRPRRAACSVYLPNRAIPMLPEPLSANLCSLVPGEDRLAMVARIDYDRDARAVDDATSARRSSTRARAWTIPAWPRPWRATRAASASKYEPFLPALRAMDALARQLRAARQARGALDLDLPESWSSWTTTIPRLVRDVRRARRDPGERHAYAMIEEFMLAANEAVGDSFRDRSEDTAWRVHDVPDEEQAGAFAVLAERYGIQFDLAEATTPLGLAAVLKRLRDIPRKSHCRSCFCARSSKPPTTWSTWATSG